MNQLSSTTNGDGTTTQYAYNAWGRVTEVIATGLRKVYTYDKGDRVTSLKVYQGSVLEMDLAYEYDAAGQLTAVISDSVRTTYTYDAAGRLAVEQNGLTGIQTHYFYTPSGLLSAVIASGGGDILKAYAYEYDRNGNQTLKIEDGRETRYYYDAVGRLETAELPDGTIQHFAYDKRGNRVEMAEIQESFIRVTTYGYDRNNRLLYSENDVEAYRYEYDPQGNQTKRIYQDIANSGTASQETEFLWNGAGQLAYSVDENGVASSYAYGPDGLRTSKSVGGEETRFFYENGSILLELDGGSRITAKTTRGLRLISRETLTAEYGYLLDGHGDVAALVNPAGGILLDYDYDPFGNETTCQPDETAQLNNPFRYCGEYWDAETQTYYLRARQYDPTTGRFLSEDTHWNPGNMLYGDDPRQLSRSIYAPNVLAIMQSSNAYAYCVNDPVTYADANGEIAGWVILALYGYAQAVLSSPDLQFDMEMLAFDISQGDYVSAAFDVVDILAPGISGSKMIPKLIGKYSDDAVDAAKIGKATIDTVSDHSYATSKFIKNSKELYEKSKSHIFSADHKDRGILGLGENEVDIYNKLVGIINEYSEQAVSGSNEIRTVIQGTETTIRFFVENETIIGLNAFVGYSGRQVGKLLTK